MSKNLLIILFITFTVTLLTPTAAAESYVTSIGKLLKLLNLTLSTTSTTHHPTTTVASTSTTSSVQTRLAVLLAKLNDYVKTPVTLKTTLPTTPAVTTKSTVPTTKITSTTTKITVPTTKITTSTTKLTVPTTTMKTTTTTKDLTPESCEVLIARFTVLSDSIETIQTFVTEDLLRASQMNQTAADCLVQSALATTTSQRDALLSMSQEYSRMAETYNNQSSDTQQLADSLTADLEKLKVNMQNQSCKIPVKTTSVLMRIAAPTTEGITSTTKPTTSTTRLPFINFNGNADFGFVSKIALEIIEGIFNDAFGGLTYEQIFTSIFSGTQVCGETFVVNSSAIFN